MLADLADELNEHASRVGAAAARRWYWRQALGSIVPLVRRRAGRQQASSRAPACRPRQTSELPLARRARRRDDRFFRSPGFTALVVITLALGIGANTAIFTVMDALLLKPLPYADAERLVRVAEWPRTGGNFTVAPSAFVEWRLQLRRITAVQARTCATIGLLEGDPKELRIARVTSGYSTSWEFISRESAGRSDGLTIGRVNRAVRCSATGSGVAGSARTTRSSAGRSRRLSVVYGHRGPAARLRVRPHGVRAVPCRLDDGGPSGSNGQTLTVFGRLGPACRWTTPTPSSRRSPRHSMPIADPLDRVGPPPSRPS